MKTPVILALDMGTSSVRAMLFDGRGRPLPNAEVQLPYVQRTTADGGVEADAELLLARTTECARQLLKQTDKDTQARIVGVGASCFWHSLVGVDGNGRAATPLLSWADTRSAPQADALRGKLNAADYHARTGAELHPSFWPAKLLWLQQAKPHEFTQVKTWMGFDEYLLLRWFGQAHVSLSQASGTGVFNQNGKTWDDDTLNALPVSREQLLPISDAPLSGLQKEFARLLPALKNLPVCPAWGDGACSNVGSGAASPERIAVNVGTSGAMRVCVPAESFAPVPGLFCYRVDGQRFLVGGALASGGNVFAWNRATLQLGDEAAMLRRLATMPPDAHGLTVLPFWAGERSPGWHADARACVVGMNLHTTPLDILRASLESVAYRFASVADALRGQFPNAAQIVAGGGAIAHDPAWVQILADVLGAPVTVSRVGEASARGAALLALHALGIVKDLNAAPAFLGRTFTPNAARHAVYLHGRQRHDALYAQLIQ